MATFMIYFLFLLLFVYAVYFILGLFKVTAAVQNAVTTVFALICLIWLMQYMGFFARF